MLHIMKLVIFVHTCNNNKLQHNIMQFQNLKSGFKFLFIWNNEKQNGNNFKRKTICIKSKYQMKMRWKLTIEFLKYNLKNVQNWFSLILIILFPFSFKFHSVFELYTKEKVWDNSWCLHGKTFFWKTFCFAESNKP